MITTNVYQRVFFFKYGNSTGTAFTVDVDERQYLVTAGHVCPTLNDGDHVEIYRHGAWVSFPVGLVGRGMQNQVEADVVVLSPPVQLSPSYPMPLGSEGLIWGQDVFFLGFPYGLHTVAAINNGFPIPIVKGALLSGTIGDKDSEVFLLDGHNNPGFSGGPVVYKPIMRGGGADYKVLGLVSGYRTESLDVTLNGQSTGLTSPANTGIVLCPSITRVEEIIRANPIGVALAANASA